MSEKSVEELLRSLRSTLERKKSNEEQEVYELATKTKTLEISANSENVISNLVKEVIAQKVTAMLSKNDEIIAQALDKLVENSDDIRSDFSNAIVKYLEARPNYIENLVKEIIERKIAKLMG